MSEANYIQVPNVVDDSDLDVYQYRIWTRIKRRGVCYESQRSIAESTKISLAQVNKTIKWLRKHGWIEPAVDKSSGKIGYSAVMPGEQVQQNSVIPEKHVIPQVEHVIPEERHLKKNPKEKITTVAREAEAQNQSAISFYENNIGGLSPKISELIYAAIDEYSEKTVIEAMNEAVLANVRRWNYVNAILENWKRNGRAKPSTNGNGRHATPPATPDDGVWDKVLAHARRGDAKFDDPAIRAAVVAYGWPKLQGIPEGKENFYKPEFMRIYHAQSATTPA